MTRQEDKAFFRAAKVTFSGSRKSGNTNKVAHFGVTQLRDFASVLNFVITNFGERFLLAK
jgi:hypothetical protein